MHRPRLDIISSTAATRIEEAFHLPEGQEYGVLMWLQSEGGWRLETAITTKENAKVIFEKWRTHSAPHVFVKFGRYPYDLETGMKSLPVMSILDMTEGSI